MIKKAVGTAIASFGLLATPANAAVQYNPGNGHYYQFVAQSFTWQQALDIASITFAPQGYSAHLVTITDLGEDIFVENLIGSSGPYFNIWAAGSDAEVDGTWKWMAGPEAGQVFYIEGGPTIGYSGWEPGEPDNDAFVEDSLQLRNGYSVGTGWNDFEGKFTISDGFVIEFSPIAVTGDVPEPASWAMMIAGFGVIGAGLRIRTRKVALNKF